MGLGTDTLTIASVSVADKTLQQLLLAENAHLIDCM